MKEVKLGSKKLAMFLVMMLCCTMLWACSNSGTTTNKSDEAQSSAAPEPAPEPEKKENGPLSIKYVGNSCFYLTFPDGTTILTDPYPAKYAVSFGPAPQMEADAYTISHYHEDHVPAMKQLKGTPKAIIPKLMTDAVTVGGVEITGFNTKHVNNMGDNEVYIFRFGDLKIVHMGETDRLDTPEVQEAVKDADVVLTYAGGYGPDTLDNAEVFQSIYDLGAKVIIPQHFSNNPDAIFYDGPTKEQLLKKVPSDVESSTLDELIVTKELEKQFVVLSQMNAK